MSVGGIAFTSAGYRRLPSWRLHHLQAHLARSQVSARSRCRLLTRQN